MRRRLLGPREEIRVGGAYAIASARLEERVREGERVRDDFVVENESRSDAVELLEGILLNAARAYEELKVPLMGECTPLSR